MRRKLKRCDLICTGLADELHGADQVPKFPRQASTRDGRVVDMRGNRRERLSRSPKRQQFEELLSLHLACPVLDQVQETLLSKRCQAKLVDCDKLRKSRTHSQYDIARL